MTRTSLIIALAGLAVLTGGLTGALSAQEHLWEKLLRTQLESEKYCQLNYLTNMRPLIHDGYEVLKARAHCNDRRMFEVTWLPEEQKFAIRPCEPPLS